MIAGLFYSIYGFLLDPNVLAAVLHKEKYEMYPDKRTDLLDQSL